MASNTFTRSKKKKKTKKAESIWKTAVSNVAGAEGHAESAYKVTKVPVKDVPVKDDPGHKPGAAAETRHFLA